MNGASYYSLRRLSPYQGTVQVAEMPGLRAMSADGVTWQVQLQNQGTRYSAREIWRADGRGTLIETEFTRDFLRALEQHPPLPFPLADRLELWLLDAAEAMPLAILASALPHMAPPRLTRVDWQAALKGDEGFHAMRYASLNPGTGAAPYHEVLESRIRETAGPRPRAQWFRRDEDGGGEGCNGFDLDPALEGRRLGRERFPELLLRERWDNRGDSYLVRDYHDRHAVRLLTHSRLARLTRDRLERAACRQAEQLYQVRHLLPEIVNAELVQVAMVEAVIRRSTSTAA